MAHPIHWTMPRPLIRCVRCGEQYTRDISRLCMDCYREMRVDDDRGSDPHTRARNERIEASCVRAETQTRGA